MIRRYVIALIAVGVAASGFALGRASVADGILSSAPKPSALVARFDGGTLSPDAVRDALTGVPDAKQRRSLVEQVIRARLLALEAEKARLHRSPEFVNRYAEELARLYVEKEFEEPFKKKLPTDEEVRKFFDENKAKLGRPERVRLAHVILLAPPSDAAARAEKRAKAEKILAEARRASKDDYAFGRLAIAHSEDPRSRSAAGELPFLTREELSAGLGAEVAEAAFALAPGRVADRVIETAHGFEIVKALAREERRDASFEDLRDSIKARLTADRRDKAFQEFMDAIWNRSDVKIDDKALEQLASETAHKRYR